MGGEFVEKTETETKKEVVEVRAGEGSDEVSACEGGTGPKDSSDAKVKFPGLGARGTGQDNYYE